MISCSAWNPLRTSCSLHSRGHTGSATKLSMYITPGSSHTSSHTSLTPSSHTSLTPPPTLPPHLPHTSSHTSLHTPPQTSPHASPHTSLTPPLTPPAHHTSHSHRTDLVEFATSQIIPRTSFQLLPTLSPHECRMSVRLPSWMMRTSSNDEHCRPDSS